MTTNSPTATDPETELAIIECIQRGLADVEAGRTVSHKVAMKSLRKIIDAAVAEKDQTDPRSFLDHPCSTSE